MKNIFSFLGGLLLGPIIVALFFWFFVLNNSSNKIKSKRFAKTNKTVTFKISLPKTYKADFPVKTLFPYMVISTRIMDFGATENSRIKELKPLESMPDEVKFEIDSDLIEVAFEQKNDFGEKNPSFAVLIVFANSTGKYDMVNTELDNRTKYLASGYVTFELTDADISTNKELNLGTIYLSDFYADYKKANPCLPSNGSKTITIDDINGQFTKANGDKNLFLVSTLHRHGFFANSEKVYTDIRTGEYGSLFEVIGPVEFKQNKSVHSWSPNSNVIMGDHHQFLLLSCAKSNSKDECLAKFSEDFFAKRKYFVKNTYVPLVPKDFKTPACGDTKINLYAYPFDKDPFSPNQFMANEKNPSAPSEVID